MVWKNYCGHLGPQEEHINHSVLDEVKVDCPLEALIMKLKLSYVGHLIQRSLEKSPMLRTSWLTKDKVVRYPLR